MGNKMHKISPEKPSSSRGKILRFEDGVPVFANREDFEFYRKNHPDCKIYKTLDLAYVEMNVKELAV